MKDFINMVGLYIIVVALLDTGYTHSNLCCWIETTVWRDKVAIVPAKLD